MTAIGRGVPEPEAIRQDAESDRSAAAAGQASEPEEGANRALRSNPVGPSVARERDYPLPDRN